MSADEREAEQAPGADHAPPHDGNGTQNKITNSTVDNAVQASVIHGDIHFHSHRVSPPQPQVNTTRATVHRWLFGTPPIILLARYIFRIIAARSPVLLWAAFSYSLALATGDLLSAVLGGPVYEMSLAAEAVVAACSGLLLLRRRFARRRETHRWPSWVEVHPKLAARTRWARRTMTISMGVVLFPLLALGFLPDQPTSEEAATQWGNAVWMLAAAVACVGALIHRYRTARAAQSAKQVEHG